jgi:hypothetical protein
MDLDLDAITPTWFPGTRYLDDREVVVDALSRPCGDCGEPSGQPHIPGCEYAGGASRQRADNLQVRFPPPPKPCRSCKRDVNNPDRAEVHAASCRIAHPRVAKVDRVTGASSTLRRPR